MNPGWFNGLFVLILLTLSCLSVSAQEAKQVVIYSSVDQPYAGPILRDFQRQTGIKVTYLPDTEATKSVGLAELLRAQKEHPQADVWWSNEPFHTIALADEGLLDEYESPAAKDIPQRYQDPKHRWTGTGLRLRVLAAAQGVEGAKEIKGLNDLSKPEFKGKIVLARPTAGTTGGHVAALYALWGDDKADAYFRQLKDNGVKLVGGNSIVAEQVGQGAFLAGITDNDDATVAQREGAKIEVILPDQDSFGTLGIPTTVGLVHGAQHPEAARKLIDYLLAKQVEQELIRSRFAKLSVREEKPAVKLMDVDYAEVARKLPQAIRRVMAILEAR